MQENRITSGSKELSKFESDFNSIGLWIKRSIFWC